MILGQWAALGQWGEAPPIEGGLHLDIATEKWVSLLPYTFPESGIVTVALDFNAPNSITENQQLFKLKRAPLEISARFEASGAVYVYVATNTEARELSGGTVTQGSRYILSVSLNITSGGIVVALDSSTTDSYTINSPTDFSEAITTEGINTSLGNADNMTFTDSVIRTFNINDERTYDADDDSSTGELLVDTTSGSNGTVVTNSSNTAPEVTVTADKATYAAGETITFSADATDINGDTLTYSWITGETTQSITVIAPSNSTNSQVTRSCIVNDGNVNSASSSETVDVLAQENRAPTLSVTSNKSTYAAGENITFTATASDADGDALTYLWSSGETTQTITVTAPTSGTSSTVTRSCVANDGQADSDIEFETVNVNAEVDTTAPVITVSGPESQSIAYNGSVPTFTSSTDDGSTVVVGGDIIDNQTAGTYTKTYNSTDGENEAIQVTRTVIVNEEVDTTAPVITVSGPESQTIVYGSAVPTFSSSTDDGSAITIGGDTIDNQTAGTYTKTYDSTDGTNSATQVTRTVIVSEDVTAPVITVSGPSLQTIAYNGTVPTFSATTDDGSAVVVGGDTIDNQTAGTYTKTYNATDGTNAATQVTRSVTVEEEADTTAPVITVTPGSQTIAYGGITPVFTATANDGSTVVVGGNTLDVYSAGLYTLTFNATDAAGNVATQVTRTVTVQEEIDTTAPIISVSGSTSTTIAYDGTVPLFTASAQGSVVNITGDVVDNQTAGAYVIRFNSTDIAGNLATQVTRTVIVEEEVVVVTIPPTAPTDPSQDITDTMWQHTDNFYAHTPSITDFSDAEYILSDRRDSIEFYATLGNGISEQDGNLVVHIDDSNITFQGAHYHQLVLFDATGNKLAPEFLKKVNVKPILFKP